MGEDSDKKKKSHPIVVIAGGADGAEAGPILIGNIVVGLLMGTGIQWLLPQSDPWGMVCGLLLGIASGFYQVFKREAMLTRRWKAARAKKKKLEEEEKEKQKQ